MIPWLLNQGGAGIVAVLVIYAVVHLWRRLTHREDKIDGQNSQRRDSLERQIDQLRATHLKELGELHASYGRQISSLQEKRVNDQKLILQAANAHADVAEVMRDAITSLDRSHDLAQRQTATVTAVLMAHGIQVVYEEPRAEPRSPLRADSVRIVTAQDTGMTTIEPSRRRDTNP